MNDATGGSAASVSPTTSQHQHGSNTTGAAPTVAEFLARPLGAIRRVDELTELCSDVAGQPIETTVADLRCEIQRRKVGIEDQWRLHVLISQLYNLRPDVTPELVKSLRADVAAAYETGRTGALHQDHERR